MPAKRYEVTCPPDGVRPIAVRDLDTGTDAAVDIAYCDENQVEFRRALAGPLPMVALLVHFDSPRRVVDGEVSSRVIPAEVVAIRLL